MVKKMLRSHRDLMNALMEIMAVKEYDTITVSEICRLSGYNRGTFYQNFKDKDELLNTIIDLKLQDMVKILKEKYHNDGKRRTQDLTALYEYIRKNSHFFKVVLQDNKIIGFRYKMFLAYKSYLEEALKVPLEKDTNSSDLNDFYFHYVTSAFLGVTMYWINEGMQKSPNYLTEQLINIVYTRPHDLILGKIPFRKTIIRKKEEIDPRIYRTKKAFKNSLIYLMKNKKYNNIRVNDIVNLAGYNRSTFYSHYNDKDHLFHDTVSDLIKGMISSISAEDVDIYSGKTGANTPLVRLFTYIYENRTLLEVMYSDNKVPGFFNKIYTSLIDFFLNELEGKMDVDAEIYCHYLVSTLMSAIGYWVSINKIKYSPIFFADLYTEVLQKESIVKL
jgi:Transcriptional regulator